MAGVGKDLWGSPSTTPCRSRVTYSRLHRTLSRQVLNTSREGKLTEVSENPFTDSQICMGSLDSCVNGWIV